MERDAILQWRCPGSMHGGLKLLPSARELTDIKPNQGRFVPGAGGTTEGKAGKKLRRGSWLSDQSPAVGNV